MEREHLLVNGDATRGHLARWRFGVGGSDQRVERISGQTIAARVGSDRRSLAAASRGRRTNALAVLSRTKIRVTPYKSLPHFAMVDAVVVGIGALIGWLSGKTMRVSLPSTRTSLS